MKIGIIGSGIAGLAAGWILSKSGHQVTIFERGARCGMSAHSVDFSNILGLSDGLDSQALVGDVPSRMFNSELWPNLFELYKQASVPVEPVNNQQTFSNSANEQPFKLSLPYRLNSLGADLLNSRKRRVLTEVAKLRSLGTKALESGGAAKQTFGEFLQSHSFEKDFKNQFLFPALSATVFTCPYTELLKYPAATVLAALSRISSPVTDRSSPLMKTVNGSDDVVTRLLQPIEEICLSSEVKNIRRDKSLVNVTTANGQTAFDHVIVATQANHVQTFADEVCRDAVEILNSFQYVTVPVVVHSDPFFMPTNQKDWSTFNFATSQPVDGIPPSAMCTVWMNRFHSNWPKTTPVFQTIFPTRNPDKSKTIRSVELQRPVVNSQTESLLNSLDRLHQQPDRKIWFVGSYAAAGVPLLESGVVSSINVCKKIAQLTSSVSCAIEN